MLSSFPAGAAKGIWMARGSQSLWAGSLGSWAGPFRDQPVCGRLILALPRAPQRWLCQAHLPSAAVPTGPAPRKRSLGSSPLASGQCRWAVSLGCHFLVWPLSSYVASLPFLGAAGLVPTFCVLGRRTVRSQHLPWDPPTHTLLRTLLGGVGQEKVGRPRKRRDNKASHATLRCSRGGRHSPSWHGLSPAPSALFPSRTPTRRQDLHFC